MTTEQKETCFLGGGDCNTCCNECDPFDETYYPSIVKTGPGPITLPSNKCLCLDIKGLSNTPGYHDFKYKWYGTDLGDCISIVGDDHKVVAHGGDDVLAPRPNPALVVDLSWRRLSS